MNLFIVVCRYCQYSISLTVRLWGAAPIIKHLPGVATCLQHTDHFYNRVLTKKTKKIDTAKAMLIIYCNCISNLYQSSMNFENGYCQTGPYPANYTYVSVRYLQDNECSLATLPPFHCHLDKKKYFFLDLLGGRPLIDRSPPILFKKSTCL